MLQQVNKRVDQWMTMSTEGLWECFDGAPIGRQTSNCQLKGETNSGWPLIDSTSQLLYTLFTHAHTWPYTHTHTHTHTERERERDRQTDARARECEDSVKKCDGVETSLTICWYKTIFQLYWNEEKCMFMKPEFHKRDRFWNSCHTFSLFE